MKLQELTSKAGVNVKQMSKTVKTTTVYPDYNFFNFFSLGCFPLYRYAARPITEPYRTAKKGYISVYRYIDTALVTASVSEEHNPDAMLYLSYSSNYLIVNLR